MFVDNSGRRSKLLRRIGLLVGVVCFGYAVVLGMAFMGIGTSINPSSLVPFGGGGGGAGPGGQGGNGPAGYAPQGGLGNGVQPGGTPSAPPTSTATATATPTTTN
ncbi:hypothetical protein ACFWWT_07245 [Streptomyces sp. NPDC058676]|uniref:hypothetical protein n=1 Tax=unclassified Streptomyces TaxID=2593676 RepID=UPI0036654FAA